MTMTSRIVCELLCDIVYYTPAIDLSRNMNEREVDDPRSF
jgi:hypothetical protein